jgi:hypothetical protein
MADKLLISLNKGAVSDEISMSMNRSGGAI